MSARADLRVLWATRRSSGLPWPFMGVVGRNVIGGWQNRLHMLVFGMPTYTARSHLWQAARIPLRPWRYARMVCNIARVRNRDYAPSLYDDVP